MQRGYPTSIILFTRLLRTSYFIIYRKRLDFCILHCHINNLLINYFSVGDIPDPGAMSRNRSRDDVSSVNSSNMQIKTTQKSFSLFAPWTPRHYNDPYDVNYAQKPRKVQRNSSRNYEPGSLQKKKSYSQTTLSRRPPNHNQSRLSNSTTTLNRRRDSKSKENDNFSSLSRNKNRQSNEVLNKDGGDRISRSISMPKDSNKKAGWFNLNKNKKQETNTRVR